MQLMSAIMAREGVLFVFTGLVENICSGSLNPRKGMGSMAPAALNKKPTSSHNNTPPETNK
jgi:hypothetical protein